MNIREFNTYLKENAKIEINNRVNEIDVSDYLPTKTRVSFNRLIFVRLITSLIMVLILFGLIILNLNPTTVLRFEINPELEVKLNIFNRVISIEGKNEDGMALVDEINYRFKKINHVIDDIYLYSQEHDLTVNDNLYVLIGVKGLKEQKQEKLTNLFIFDNQNVKTLLIPIITSQEINFRNSQISAPEAIIGNEDEVDTLPSGDVNNLPTTYLEIASNYEISEVKFSLIIEIYFENSSSQNQVYFEYLLGLELYQLFELYSN